MAKNFAVLVLVRQETVSPGSLTAVGNKPPVRFTFCSSGCHLESYLGVEFSTSRTLSGLRANTHLGHEASGIPVREQFLSVTVRRFRPPRRYFSPRNRRL